MSPASRHRVRSGSTRRRGAPVTAAVALVMALGACGETEGDGSGDPPELGEGVMIESTTDPAPEPGSAPAPAPAPATTLPPTVGTPDPETTAGTLYMAWMADDRSLAATVAEPAAVDDIWATHPGDYSLYNRCSTGEFGGAQCLYRGPGGTIQFSMEQVDEAWVVRRAIFSPA